MENRPEVNSNQNDPEGKNENAGRSEPAGVPRGSAELRVFRGCRRPIDSAGRAAFLLLRRADVVAGLQARVAFLDVVGEEIQARRVA
jgi:hypothetical protein